MFRGRGFAILLVTIAASIWGLMSLVTKPMMDAGMTPLEVSFLRMSVAALSIFVFTLMFKKNLLRIDKADIFLFIFIGVTRLLSNALMYYTQDVMFISLGVVLEMTAPCFVVVFSYFIFKQEITAKNVGVITAVFIGCCLAVGIFTKGGNVNAIGIIAGILSGVTLALFVIGSKIAVSREYHPETIIVYCFAIAGITSLPFINLGNIVTVTENHPEFILYILVLGIVMTSFSYVLNLVGMKKLKATTVSLINVVEVIVATIVGWVAFGETLSFFNISGMLLIIIALVIANVQLESFYEKITNVIHK